MARRNAARANITVHDHDVLNGRGVNIAQHPGNQRFRSLINSRTDPNYCENFTAAEKKAIATSIIAHIVSLDPPGRFLKRPTSSNGHRNFEGPWEELTQGETDRKAKQALRDCNRGDRAGYAEQVQPPQDVLDADEERRRSGLSLQEEARRLIEEESSRGSTRTRSNTNNRRKTPRASGTSRTPRTQRGRAAHAATAAAAATSQSSNGWTDQPQNAEDPIQEYEQVSGVASAMPARREASAEARFCSTTPTAPPHMAPVPVTETPHQYNGSFLPQRENGHYDRSNYSGTQPAMMAPAPAPYHNGYASRADGNHGNHQIFPTESLSSMNAMHSPIVSQAAANSTLTLRDDLPDQLQMEEIFLQNHRQNLFDDHESHGVANGQYDILDDDGFSHFESIDVAQDETDANRDIANALL